MTESLTQDIAKSSVTKGDIFEYNGSGGLVNLLLPFFWFNNGYVGTLPPDVPQYWSPNRDYVLRSTLTQESFWAAAVAIATTKAAAQSFTVSGPPRLARRAQQLMLQWGGQGYVPSQEKGVTDFSTTDNGEFHEIVRASSAAGSRILGLVHLDSLRCTRTGDPERPVLYRDLHGYLHELRDYQVITLADQPDPSASWYGTGHCAAARAYPHIFRMAAIEKFIAEKITGAGAHKMTFLKGIGTEQIRGLLNVSEAEKATKGFIYYQGTILAGILGDLPLEMKEIVLRGLPENFNRKEELDIGLLAYADALGMDPQDLQPLSGQGLGTGAQSRVLFEKSKGRGMAARNKMLNHLLNEWVVPDRVTFAWNERDLTDEMKQAEITEKRVATRAAQIQSGEITTEMARQMGADLGDIPADFVPNDLLPTEVLGDETKPTAEDAASPELTEDLPTAPIPQPGQDIASQPTAGSPTPEPAPAAEENKALTQLQATKALMQIAKDIRQMRVGQYNARTRRPT